MGGRKFNGSNIHYSGLFVFPFIESVIVLNRNRKNRKIKIDGELK